MVDDGSTDRTAELALEANARVARHRSNRGYGAALKTASSSRVKKSSSLPMRTGPIRANTCLNCWGLSNGGYGGGARNGANVQIPLVRRPAKWLLNIMANYVSGARIPDLNSGLRADRRGGRDPILPDLARLLQLDLHGHDRHALRQVRSHVPSHRLSRVNRQVEDRAVGRGRFRRVDIEDGDVVPASPRLSAGDDRVLRLWRN